ncbi:MAG: glutathione S-transferase, partial [Pseudomonadota bacterium]|nr:glutathione S-transferase [Pseudomonadota bacterium]
MIKLYGLKMSNYYSLTKALLIEKGLEFEEVKAPPTQKEDNLARSPMGKMPSIEVGGQYMSESLAIALYLEKLSPENPMFPADPFQAGKVMELICHIKLDTELVARRCIAEAFFGGKVSDETKE